MGRTLNRYSTTNSLLILNIYRQLRLFRRIIGDKTARSFPSLSQMNDQRCKQTVFINILGKIQVLKNRLAHISAESILVSDIENQSSPGETRTETEAKEIIRAPLSRGGIIKSAAAQWYYIFGFNEEILGANSNRVCGIDIRVVFWSSTNGGGFIAL